jgi:hypothetical protein
MPDSKPEWNEGPTIDRSRISSEPTEVQSAEEANWHAAWEILHRLCTVPTTAEFFQLLIGFPSAYTNFRKAVRASFQEPERCPPIDITEGWLKDQLLESRVKELVAQARKNVVLRSDPSRRDLTQFLEVIDRFRDLRAFAPRKSHGNPPT